MIGPDPVSGPETVPFGETGISKFTSSRIPSALSEELSSTVVIRWGPELRLIGVFKGLPGCERCSTVDRSPLLGETEMAPSPAAPGRPAAAGRESARYSTSHSDLGTELWRGPRLQFVPVLAFIPLAMIDQPTMNMVSVWARIL